MAMVKIAKMALIASALGLSACTSGTVDGWDASGKKEMCRQPVGDNSERCQYDESVVYAKEYRFKGTYADGRGLVYTYRTEPRPIFEGQKREGEGRFRVAKECIAALQAGPVKVFMHKPKPGQAQWCSTEFVGYEGTMSLEHCKCLGFCR